LAPCRLVRLEPASPLRRVKPCSNAQRILQGSAAGSAKPSRRTSFFYALLAALALPALVPAAPAGEFRPGELWPDNHGVPINAHGGGILFHGGRYYWFGEHKIAGAAGNAAHVGVHVYSSTNLYEWRDDGIALPVSEDPQSDIADGCILERPKVIFNRPTGKFVMWFHLELKGRGYAAARSGVAVGDAPAGPYRFLGSFRPNAGVWPKNVTPADQDPKSRLARDFAGGQMARDMTLFVDDDGAAYHFYSSEDNQTMHVSKLTADYLRPAGEYVRILCGQNREAPAVCKRRGKYWLITSDCSGWDPNPAGLAVADSIWGPWTNLGNPCVGQPRDVNTTFHAQSTFILPVAGRPDTFIFLADRWRPRNAIDGRYVWLPLIFKNDRPVLAWQDRWSLP